LKGKEMTFEEFLAYVREHIGTYCTDAYWRFEYNNLADKSQEFVEKETPFLAVHAIGTDYTSKNG